MFRKAHYNQCHMHGAIIFATQLRLFNTVAVSVMGFLKAHLHFSDKRADFFQELSAPSHASSGTQPGSRGHRSGRRGMMGRMRLDQEAASPRERGH